jgi:hypothetical protein
MVIPADRLLDMTQTALNVWGDMIAAVHPDRKRLRYRRAKNIKKIREQRLAKEEMLAKAPANQNAPAPAAAAPAVNAPDAPKPPAP